jgi:type IV pilus assembly protein PilP
MITRPKIRSLLSLTILVLLICSCNNNEGKRELQQYIANLKSNANMPGKKPLLKQFQLPAPVKYLTSETNNGSSTGPGSSGGNNAVLPSKPLQSYPLKDLQYVGNITQDNQTWAYILTPDNMIYGAKLGDIIGNTYGKIVKITGDHIEVLEQHTETGKPVQSIVTIELKE